jgi:hypothetical protein
MVGEAEANRGPFTLFALARSKDSRGLWEIILSGVWVDADRLNAMRDIAKRLAGALAAEEMLQVSRLVPLHTSDESVRSLVAWLAGVQLPVEVGDFVIGGASVRVAYVVVARGPTGPAVGGGEPVATRPPDAGTPNSTAQ